jgi:hypothetical protein
MVLFTGRTANADNDTMVLGLDGDLGADTGFTMPSNWPFTGVVVSDANLHIRAQVIVTPLTDNGVAGAGAGVGFSVEEASAPWEKTIRMNGTPNAAVTLSVLVWYPHTMLW